MSNDNVINFCDYVNKKRKNNHVETVHSFNTSYPMPVSPFPGMDQEWTEDELKALDEALMEAFPKWTPPKD